MPEELPGLLRGGVSWGLGTLFAGQGDTRNSSSVLGEQLAQGAHDKSCVILHLFEHKRFQGFSNSNLIKWIVTGMTEFIDVWYLCTDKYWGIYNQNHNNEYFQKKKCLCSFSAWKSWQWGPCFKRRCRLKISLPPWGRSWTSCPTSLAATSSSRRDLRSSPRLEVELPHQRRSTVKWSLQGSAPSTAHTVHIKGFQDKRLPVARVA